MVWCKKLKSVNNAISFMFTWHVVPTVSRIAAAVKHIACILKIFFPPIELFFLGILKIWKSHSRWISLPALSPDCLKVSEKKMFYLQWEFSIFMNWIHHWAPRVSFATVNVRNTSNRVNRIINRGCIKKRSNLSWPPPRFPAQIADSSNCAIEINILTFLNAVTHFALSWIGICTCFKMSDLLRLKWKYASNVKAVHQLSNDKLQ